MLRGDGAAREVVLGLLAALRQRGLEVRGRLRGAGALLLEDRLGLLAPHGGVVRGLVEDVVGLAAGVLEGAGRVGLGGTAGLRGVALGLRAQTLDLLRGLPAPLLDLRPGGLPQLLGLLLGQLEDGADPGAEVRPRRLRRGPRRAAAG
ncbi:hypothetical protein [Georgenia sp. SUBG003]|uniref:hypothetical protein n=1 Tax=Georgenia sp. SUBG003 TaxID=1497974 RepID=UPI003AB71C22